MNFKFELEGSPSLTHRLELQGHGDSRDFGDDDDPFIVLTETKFTTTGVRYGTRLGDLKENWFLLFSNSTPP